MPGIDRPRAVKKGQAAIDCGKVKTDRANLAIYHFGAFLILGSYLALIRKSSYFLSFTERHFVKYAETRIMYLVSIRD